MSKNVSVNGRKFVIRKSTRKGKQRMACPVDGGSCVHYGDPDMPEFPGTKRGDNYCARSSGIRGKDDPASPNFWARKDLWNCVGNRSRQSRVLQ